MPEPSIAEELWARGPIHPRLLPGAVHVWRADLDSAEPALDELLDPEERARAERMPGARDRSRWGRSRALLRALLGRYLDSEPLSLRFSAGPYGKPALDPPKISFNLSHSAGTALYAFCASAAVGVDVELSSRPREVLAVAARALGAEEAERLRALEPAERQREFLRAWVRREAELKLRGVGLGVGLRAREMHRQPGSWIAELDVGDGAAGALALEAPPRELRCWRWPAAPPTEDEPTTGS